MTDAAKKELMPDYVTIWRNEDGTYGVSPTDCVESVKRVSDVECSSIYTRAKPPCDDVRGVSFEEEFAAFGEWESEAYSRGVFIDEDDVEKLRLFFDFIQVRHFRTHLQPAPISFEVLRREFMTAFRGKTKGTMNRAIVARIDRGLDAIIEKLRG